MKELAAQIKGIIEMEIDRGNPDEIAGKIHDLINISASAARLKALAKDAVLKRQAELLGSTGRKGNELKMWIEAECHMEIAFYVYADRLNAYISHAIDGLRSDLSYIKSEIENGLK